MEYKGRASYSDELRFVIWNTFRDVTDTYLKEFMNITYGVLIPKDVPYSKATALTVIHIGDYFRPFFQNVFEATFTIPCPDLEEFVKYALSLCELFLREDFPFLTQKIGSGNIHFLRFLMVCSFLAEFLRYCLQKDCFMYISTIQKCMMIAYDRWLEKDIRKNGGFRELVEFCDNFRLVYDSLPCAATFKVMGLHELSLEVKEIEQRIKDCIKSFDRVQMILSDREKQLVAEDEINQGHAGSNYAGSNYAGSCVICGWRCKYHYVSSFFEAHKENSDSSPIRSEDDN